MSKIEYNIFEIEPNGLSGFRSLTNEDTSLLTSTNITKTFKPNDNFVELSYYTLSDVRLQTIPSYTNYSIISGDTQQNTVGNSEIGIDVQQDYIAYGYNGTEVKALYNFLDYTYSDNLNPQDFYIESISPDKTEVRLVSINLGGSDVLETTNQVISQFNNDTYSPDFYLYFGNNIFYSIINVDVEEFRDTTAVILKLYNPLPSSVNLKTRVNVVEKVSDSIAFEINTTITQDPPVVPTLRGANFDVELDTQTTEPSQYYNYNELFSFPTTNTYREINSMFNEKGAELGIDYSDFNNFINYSSAEERIRNFKYKLDLIESYQNNLDLLSSSNYTGQGITGSKEYYENLIKGVINNLDHYERHLFYTNSSSAWPKSNSTKPFINQPSSTTEATEWYNTELQSAIRYDAQNVDILTNTIPSYLKEDPANQPYELFIHMIAQHFDNLWLYTDSVSKKYDADNRLDRGVSKDLVEELLKNFGVKLYTSNKSAEDLFKYFTVNSYDTQGEYLSDRDGRARIIKSNQDQLSQNDYQKEIYKRIYHNLPLLLKSKGTERGLRALINCFGIPSDVLKIKVYGGQSTEDLPFYGGEQAWTGSLDKVRLDNTGSIVEGATLSFYTSISNKENNYTNDLHRIEVGFSPSDNINNYIVSQSNVLFPNSTFNIDNYIGDPRDVKTNKYSDLQEYAKEIFDNVGKYNLKDFVRLIKFFDNVVFRMVRDFVPARSVTDTGVIIKPHLLERSKHTSPVMTWTQPEYSSSIDTAFITGSNGGAYQNTGNGAEGTLLSKESPTRAIHYIRTPEGIRGITDKMNGQPKFNGELFRSRIRVTNGELNRGNPFKNFEYPNINYNIGFYKEPPEDICNLETNAVQGNLIINPKNDLYTNYNLANMFIGAGGDYNFEITSNRNPQPTIIENGKLEYNFLPQGYEQYDEYEVTVYHKDKQILEQQDCTKTRTAIIVSCDLAFKEINIPSDIKPTGIYNLSEWWQSSTNKDIIYYINGEPFAEANVTEKQFPVTVYGNVDSIKVEIKDLNNTSGCSIEKTIPYSKCNIGTTRTFPTVGEKYTPSYGFKYVSDSTKYYFRLEWTENQLIDENDSYEEVSYLGNWIEIDPDKQVSTGTLLNIKSQYKTADGIESKPSDKHNFNTFTDIQDYITKNYVPNNIRMRFKADEPGDCPEIIHNLTVELDTKFPEPTVQEYKLFYTTSTTDLCCTGNSSRTVYSQARTKGDFFTGGVSNIGGPDGGNAITPGIFKDKELTRPADTGYYGVNFDYNTIYRKWEKLDGEYDWAKRPSFLTKTSDTYIDCSNTDYLCERDRYLDNDYSSGDSPYRD